MRKPFPCNAKRLAALQRLAATVVIALALTAASTQAQSLAQASFASPADAVKALRDASADQDLDRTRSLFGPEISYLGSGDPIADKLELKRLAAKMDERKHLVQVNDSRVVVYIGADNWPFPIPIVSDSSGKWRFDTAVGREELLDRRIGHNELAAIRTMRAYAQAQVDYSAVDYDGNGVKEYAQRLISSSHHEKDGLYWKTEGDEPQSPLGPLIAEAAASGYGKKSGAEGKRPFVGYYFKVLTKQGANAPGGAKDYIVDGHMVRGFGMVAYPAMWGSSGVTTFVVGPDGIVFQKNLGPKTSEIAPAIDAYNPDRTWTRAQ